MPGMRRGIAAEHLDQRIDEVGGELRHEAGERGTDDDTDGEVDDVASGDEVAEAFQQPEAASADLLGDSGTIDAHAARLLGEPTSCTQPNDSTIYP